MISMPFWQVFASVRVELLVLLILQHQMTVPIHYRPTVTGTIYPSLDHGSDAQTFTSGPGCPMMG